MLARMVSISWPHDPLASDSQSVGLQAWDWDRPGQHGETPSLLKIQKISWAWLHMPVIPATQEAEAGESLEPGRRRLQWAKILPLHCIDCWGDTYIRHKNLFWRSINLVHVIKNGYSLWSTFTYIFLFNIHNNEVSVMYPLYFMVGKTKALKD